MSPKYHINRVEDLLSIIQMLGEALANDDDWHGSEPGPQLTVRGRAGMHGAIQEIAALANQHCSELVGCLEGAQATS